MKTDTTEKGLETLITRHMPDDLVTGKLDVREADARLPELRLEGAGSPEESEGSNLAEEPDEPAMEGEP